MGPRKSNPAAEGGPSQSLLTKKGPKDAWEQLLTGVAVSHSLQILRINHCSIGSEVVSTLADALRTNISLQVLDLAFNNMTDKLAV